MNILMLLFKDIHFDARVQREALALAKANHHVTIACLKEYNDEPPFLHENIRLFRIEISTKKAKSNIVASSSNNAKSNKKVLLKLARVPIIKLLKDFYSYHEFHQQISATIERTKSKFDVVHCHDLNTLPIGCKLAETYNLKTVYDSHELFNEMSGRNNLDKIVGYRLEAKYIKKITHLILVNPFVQKEFEKRYGRYPTTIIQNTPIQPEYLKERPPANNYWRNIYHLDENDIILLYQGGISPERGIEETIQATAQLPSNYKLVILGEGRIKAELINFVKENGLENKIYFHPQVPAADVLWYSMQADIGLVLYKNTSKNNYYSTPNKIFEYMQAGIPTVASNHPGKSYVVEKEETGVCVEETIESLKWGINKIVNNYDRYRENCINNRDNYKWAIEESKLVNLYNTL